MKRQSYTIEEQEGEVHRESFQVSEAYPSSACREASYPVSEACPFVAFPSEAFPFVACQEASYPVLEACP